MGFGALRVLNDDEVSPGMGFGMHGHSNMEIISIPLEGALEHRDSMGHTTVIEQGDVQVMSAGSGIQHSERNKNRDKKVSFLQIWVCPNKADVEPRYDQISLREADLAGQFYQILSPHSDDTGVWIHQNAWFHLGNFEKGCTSSYRFKDTSNGLYIFVIEGNLSANEVKLGRRDGLGIWDSDTVDFSFTEASRILLMEVPMTP